jgi:transglutaminase-like putative cysteine protease
MKPSSVRKLFSAIPDVLILESVIETLVRGSSVRWPVAGIGITYLAASAASSHRGWSHNRTIASFIVLSLMLAVTAWLPGGLVDGMRLLGLSTSTLLSLAAASGIAVSGITLMRDRCLPRQREDGPVRATQQAAALATSLAIILAALTGHRSAAATTPESHPGGSAMSQPSESGSASSAPPATDPEELLTRARQRVDRFPVVQWDVDAKARELGTGVEAAFAYVRDEIAYEPYSGVLRGASGTYTTRAGNAADRALLLARLLGQQEIRTRFAVGKLTDEQRATLFARAFARTPTQSLSAVPITTGAAFHERLFRRAKRDYDAVRAATGDHLPPVTRPTREQVLAEMNPHIWVQASVDGKWIDLDPSFGDARVGRVVGVTDRIVEELPDAVHQRVAIRVVADLLRDDALVTTTLLEVTHRAIDVIDRQVALIHSKPAAATGLGAAIAGALGQPLHEQWSPQLWIDGQATVGAPLEVDASLVAEWLEIELFWPDGRREITRRPLVERGGNAWRSARPLDPARLRPLGRDDNGPFAMQAVHNVWFSGGRHNLADFADATWEMAVTAVLETASDLERAAESSIPPPPKGGDLGEILWPFALPNFAWMVWTDHVIIPFLNDRAGIRLYADGPRISVFSTGPEDNDRTMVFADLRRDDLRGLAESAADATVLAEKKLWFGLLQGALEHEAMAEVVVVSGGNASDVKSTSSAFSDETVMVLAKDSASRIPEIVDPEAAARVRTALDRGHLIAGSSRSLQAGFWWEVVNGSGDTRAIGPLGLHSVDGGFDRRPGQVKNAGPGKAYGTDEYRKELQQARRAAENARKEQEAIKKYRDSLPKSPQGKPPNGMAAPKRGGGGGELGEYVAALGAAVLHAIAYHFLSQILLDRIFAEIDLVVDWLEKGGFGAVVRDAAPG